MAHFGGKGHELTWHVIITGKVQKILLMSLGFESGSTSDARTEKPSEDVRFSTPETFRSCLLKSNL